MKGVGSDKIEQQKRADVALAVLIGKERADRKAIAHPVTLPVAEHADNPLHVAALSCRGRCRVSSLRSTQEPCRDGVIGLRASRCAAVSWKAVKPAASRSSRSEEGRVGKESGRTCR